MQMIVGASQKRKIAQAELAYQQQLQDESVENAAVYAADSYEALQDRSIQISSAISVEKDNLRRETLRASAVESVSAAESGIVGASANDVQQSFSSTLSEHLGVLDGSERHQLTQNKREMKAVRNRQQNSIYLAEPVVFPENRTVVLDIFAAYLKNDLAGNFDSGSDSGTEEG